ncbi:MAG TPA: M20/M25/M40 family metallo-hydrolase, partial [Thermomicrobiales bacterium]|nr:M20/M25/M40 family metallo-hydrolase [Thermomicrobiales bacterium]
MPFSHRTVQAHLNDSLESGIADLIEILEIPSVSTEPEYAADVRRCSEWILARMQAIGVPEVRIVETPRHPIVLGKWHAAPGAPTILVYGHYDVQPVDPLHEWVSAPFTPTIRDGLIYARGAADMKGNLIALLQAVAA